MKIGKYIDHKWNEFNLLMTEEGFQKCGEKMRQLTHQPQVYIHVGNEGKLSNKVLRIGVSKQGAYYRCIKKNDGHMHTFLWSIGKSEKYTEKRVYKDATVNYMLFFASLYGWKTKIYVVSFDDDNKAKQAEKEFISELMPIWEKFKQAHKIDDNFPILSTRNKDLRIFAELAKCGGAMEYLKEQRDNKKKIKLPDILEWDASVHGNFVLKEYLN